MSGGTLILVLGGLAWLWFFSPLHRLMMKMFISLIVLVAVFLVLLPGLRDSGFPL